MLRKEKEIYSELETIRRKQNVYALCRSFKSTGKYGQAHAEE